MYIERTLEQKITRYLDTREIIAIVGARQCGKTTLMKHIFARLSNALFIDFEDREKLELFETDIETFIRLYVKNYEYLFIDEFQYAKQGGQNLKYIFDSQPIKIVISGSSSSDLTVKSIRYLVGRIFVFQLNPLSFQEFLAFKDNTLFQEIYPNPDHSPPIRRKLNRCLNEFLIYGGYPRVVTSETEEEKQLVLKNIYDTYFLKEIKGIFHLASDFQLSKLITALALQIGGILNYNELSTLSGLKYADLMQHLNILQKTFITLESRPFFTNKRTELVKSPKIFFLDSGLRNTVIKNFIDVNNRADAGSMRENFIASELVKKEYTLNYWRTKSRAEVDFVMQQNSEIIPIETKSKLIKPTVSKSFHSFVEKYNPALGYIVNEDLIATSKINNTEIRFVPVYQMPLYLDKFQKEFNWQVK